MRMSNGAARAKAAGSIFNDPWTAGDRHYCGPRRRSTAMAKAEKMGRILQLPGSTTAPSSREGQWPGRVPLWPSSQGPYGRRHAYKRQIQGKETHDTTCKQCGHPRKDEAHMFWGCPPTNAMKKHSIRRTNGKYFDHQTGEIGVGTPCYFYRGLMPAEWTRPHTPPEYFREELGSSQQDNTGLRGYLGHKVQI